MSTALASTVGQALAQSNIPAPEKKTLIRTFFEKATGGALAANVAPAIGYVREGLSILRGATGSVGVAGALGFAHHRFGSLDVGRNKDVPIDGIAAGLGYLSAMALANDPLGLNNDARNAANVALGIFVERKSKVFFDKRYSPTASGERDPIAEVAAEFT